MNAIFKIAFCESIPAKPSLRSILTLSIAHIQPSKTFNHFNIISVISTIASLQVPLDTKQAHGPLHEIQSCVISQLLVPRRQHALDQDPARSTTRKAWTGEELKALFEYAIKNGAPAGDSGWDGVVPGRTGQQCRNTWR